MKVYSTKQYKYMMSGKVLADIIDGVRPITDEQKRRIIEFLVDLARADDLVERIATQKDKDIRKELFEISRIFIREYKQKGYGEVYRLFNADLRWNRNKSPETSIELSKTIYSFIVRNITGFYDRRVESLIVVSNLLDDLFDMGKDGTRSLRYAIGVITEIFKYTLVSLPLILKNLSRISRLVYLSKAVARGGVEDELHKAIYMDPSYIYYEGHNQDWGFWRDKSDDKEGKQNIYNHTVDRKD